MYIIKKKKKNLISVATVFREIVVIFFCCWKIIFLRYDLEFKKCSLKSSHIIIITETIVTYTVNITLGNFAIHMTTHLTTWLGKVTDTRIIDE